MISFGDAMEYGTLSDLITYLEYGTNKEMAPSEEINTFYGKDYDTKESILVPRNYKYKSNVLINSIPNSSLNLIIS